MAEADSLPLSDQVGPCRWAAISHPSGGDVGKLPARLRQLGFESGFINDGVGIDWSYGRIECHHLTQFGSPSRDGIEEIPLKVDDSTDEVVSRVVRAWPGARHADFGMSQWRQKAAKGTCFWKNIAADEYDLAGGRI